LALAVLLAAAGPVLASGESSGDGGQDNEVCICHFPPGNPAAAHTICVGAPAVSTHLGHGDTLGPCEEVCGGPYGVPCEEGQYCMRPEGVCDEDAEGECVDSPDVCPSPFDPVCGCDERTYSNACFAAAAGVTVAAEGPCGEGIVCGGEAGDTCDDDEYCMRPVGECDEEAEGVCRRVPMSCTTQFEPVCGCDDMTYDNACVAASNGVSVAAEGECESAAQACGGDEGECDGEQVCIRPDGECEEDAVGECRDAPAFCPAIIEPVCGCDGKTYDNGCVANANGVTVDTHGECDVMGGKACGATAGDTCNEDQYCELPQGECGDDVEGVCKNKPDVCPTASMPVCGCDGKTYHNACWAAAAGTSVAATGECVGEAFRMPFQRRRWVR
jgi:hypothetical protein